MTTKSRIAKLPSTGRVIIVASPAEILAAFEAHRVAQRMGLAEVSRVAGCGEHSYQTWTRGETSAPTLTNMLAYAKALNLRVVLARQPKEPT